MCCNSVLILNYNTQAGTSSNQDVNTAMPYFIHGFLSNLKRNVTRKRAIIQTIANTGKFELFPFSDFCSDFSPDACIVFDVLFCTAFTTLAPGCIFVSVAGCVFDTISFAKVPPVIAKGENPGVCAVK